MISEEVVKNILKKNILPGKIKTYKWLLEQLVDTQNLLVDKQNLDVFKRKYKGFYAVRNRSEEFVKEYFDILLNKKFNNTEKITEEITKEIFEAVCNIQNSCETSYFSKILHNIDTSVPIYDSVVGEKHFGYKRIDYGTFERKKQRNLQMYKDYCESFIRYTKSPDGQKIIELFDKQFPEYKGNISGVKKVDFVLWQDREKVKENKVIKPQQIEIPQEFKCQR